MSSFLDIEEIWTVDESDANRLLKVGWKFVQAIVKISGEGDGSLFGSSSEINSAMLIVMGRPKGVPERKDDYYVYKYVERLDANQPKQDTLKESMAHLEDERATKREGPR